MFSKYKKTTAAPPASPKAAVTELPKASAPNKIARKANASTATVAPLDKERKRKERMGEIKLELDAEKAPKTVANFLDYARTGYYDGTIFHRVIDNFMIQGGGCYSERKTMCQSPSTSSMDGKTFEAICFCIATNAKKKRKWCCGSGSGNQEFSTLSLLLAQSVFHCGF